MNENQWNHPRHYLGWAIFGVVAIAVVIFALSAVFFWPMSNAANYPMFYRGGFFPFGIFFGLFWLFVAFMVLRWIFWRPWSRGYGGRHWRYGYGDEYTILRQRYARGEITKDQYDQMMRDLEQHQS